jgi:pimeloyl-ACP methyl ester carboxylesterase
MRALRNTVEQKLRASYQLYLGMPLVPELTLPVVLPRALRRAGKFTDAEIDEYRTLWRQPGARHAMANYYRALRLGMPKIGTTVRTVSMPTMLIWGDREKAFSKKTIEPIREWVPHIRIEHIREAGHFVQTDAPELVSQLMIEFLKS